jgi:hypothetical protein
MGSDANSARASPVTRKTRFTPGDYQTNVTEINSKSGQEGPAFEVNFRAETGRYSRDEAGMAPEHGDGIERKAADTPGKNLRTGGIVQKNRR